MSQWNDRSEVERIKAMFLEAAAGEAERVASLLAESADEDLLGKTELALRDLRYGVTRMNSSKTRCV